MTGLLRASLAACLIIATGYAVAESNPTLPVSAQKQADTSLQEKPAAGPVQMLRTLQLMQDQIATGSTEAHVAQRGLLAVLDESFMNFEPEVWRDSKNTRAAVALVLSGGKPQILRRILSLGSAFVSRDETPLIEGALAYVEGREEEARRTLLPINPASLPVALGAQIALVQSALLVKTDLKKSDELLDFVRLQVPGTLLEEAALRRQVLVVSQIDESARFGALATQYLRRYRHSVYAGNFRQRLASVITRIDFGKDPSRFEIVVGMMAELEPEARRDLYLLAAQASIEQGFTQSAVLMAGKALELVGDDKQSAARAKLYQASAMIVSPDTLETAVKELQGLDRSILAAGDLALLDAAMALADQIRKMPERILAKESEHPPSKETVNPPPAEGPTASQASEQLAAVSKARDALNRVDQLIKNQAAVSR